MSTDWSSARSQSEAPGWLGQPQDEIEDGALAVYTRALRSHKKWVFAVFVIVLAAAIGFALGRTPTYNATAQIQINPLPQTDTTLLGLGLIQDSGDPTTNVETAASVIDTQQAARQTAAALGNNWSAQSVQSAVNVQPQGQSNILDVTATASSPRLAAELADTFTIQALAIRSQHLKVAVAQAIASARAQLAGLSNPDSVAGSGLQASIAQLAPLSTGKDPTMSLSQPAVVPKSSSGLTKAEIALLGLLAAVVLASGSALLVELLSTPRILTEEQLLGILPAPVFARIPMVPRRLSRRRQHWLRQALPPGVSEAFRGVRIQLDLLGGRHRTLLITSPYHGDGKTTIAVNLAREIAESGANVILLDADLRKPDQASMLGVEATADLPTALESDDPMLFLRDVPGLPSIKLLPTWQDERFDTLDRVARGLGEFLVQALEEADYVIIDTPPLGELTDVLRFANKVDDILLVSRLGNTTLGSAQVTSELLDRVDRWPTGHLLIGTNPRQTPGYYYRSPAPVDEYPA
ncbi:MAG: P-loop NTPase, partial [Solirubrobacterales bacterium]|nr:P-loop NTPase [Solirubrobacterales bacterium]